MRRNLAFFLFLILLLSIYSPIIFARDCAENEVSSPSNLCVPPIGASSAVGGKFSDSSSQNANPSEEIDVEYLKTKREQLQTQLDMLQAIYDAIQVQWETCMNPPYSGTYNGKHCVDYEQEGWEAGQAVAKKQEEIDNLNQEIIDKEYAIPSYQGAKTEKPSEGEKQTLKPMKSLYLSQDFINFQPLELSDYQKQLLADSKSYQSFSEMLEKAAVNANPNLKRVQSLSSQSKEASPFLSGLNNNLDRELETKGMTQIPVAQKVAYRGLAKKSKALYLSQDILNRLATDNSDYSNLWGYNE